jgi:2-dehydro-3-deoxyphosphogluconate aldolase/(4S)-4-hydroxy-2-oxoglutarate aldolase
MESVIERISQLKLVPVVKLENPVDAVPLARALIEGGLPIAEITFRTDAAEQAIKNIKEEVPEIFLGAGTVLTVENVKKAVDAGATFIVTPGFNPEVVDYCLEHDIVITPGVNSPTQVEMGLSRGLTVLKFFPAEVSGGIKMLKAFAGPYTGVKFIPTGGIKADNLADYLATKNVLACGGSWIASSSLIAEGKFDEITALVKEAVEVINTVTSPR